MNNLLFYVTTDDKYLEFAIIYPIFVLSSNPDAVVEIGVVGKAFKRLQNQYGYLLEFYQKYYPNKVFYRNIKIYRKILPNSIRYLIQPKTKAKYVYIGDIDIMITEPILDAHLLNIKENNLDFSNIKRVNLEQLSGLHFIEYDKMYPMKLPFPPPFINLAKKNDEELLMILMKQKGYKIPDENAIKFRPIHGIHASWFSRAPLPTRTTQDEIVQYPNWASTADKLIDTKYVSQYLKIRYSKKIKDFMSIIRETDIQLRQIIQVTDMVCEYFNLHYKDNYKK